MANKEILRIRADKDQIKNMYTKLSKFYGLIEWFERQLRKKAIKFLNPSKGEIVLEIGFGRGASLVEISKAVGETGKVYGIDLTPEMIKLSKKILTKKRMLNRVELREGDARQLPYENNVFDGVYIASTLELFDTPDIPLVLKEIKRVLKPNGKLCVVSIPKEDREKSFGVKLYEWSHRTFQKYASCRPIYVEDSIKNTGYKITKTEIIGKLFPMKIVIAMPL
ncbi:MAG: class I SAM-dependent methyltransferase [Candidatus Hodarchaeota archaeon]